MRCQLDAHDEMRQCAKVAEPGRSYCREHLPELEGDVDYPPPPDDEWDDEPPSLADRIRSKIVTTAQLRKLPPPAPLVHGWLNLDSLAMLYGPSGAGKSFVAIDLAMTIQSGRGWWHGNAVTTGDVLYVAAEGTPGASLRTTAWEQFYECESAVKWHPGAVSVFDQAWSSALAEVVAEMRPALVVIDTFARSIVGADENSTRDAGLAIEHLDRIRQAAGSCVLIVHHAGKDVSKGARGNSALKGAMDTEIEVIGTENRVTVRNTKQKDAAEAHPQHFKLEPVEGTESVVLRQVGTEVEPVAITDSVLATLEALRAIDVPDGLSSSAWRAATDATERTFYRHRSALVANGLVVNVGSDKQPRYRPSSDEEVTEDA